MSDPGYPYSYNAQNSYSGSWHNKTTGSLVTSYSYTRSYIRSAGDKVGQDTPGWPAVIRDNPYYRTGYTVDIKPSRWSGFSPTTTGSGTEPVFEDIVQPSGWGSDSLLMERARNKALTKLMAALKDQKINVGVALAEHRQTANLVASTATRIASSYSSLRRGNIKGAINQLTGTSTDREVSRVRRAGSVPNQWLELQYGWRPLLSDVYGAVEQLKETYSGEPPAASVRATGKCSELLQAVGSSTFKTAITVDWRRKASARVTAFIEYDVSNSLAQVASSTGVSNPLSIAWEVIPYSFVVDWFIPVGNYLNNLDYDAGLTFGRGYVSLLGEGDNSARIKQGKVVSGSTTQIYSGGAFYAKGFTFRREVMSGFPSVPLPQFKNPFSLTHVANALSLLSTAFGRR